MPKLGEVVEWYVLTIGHVEMKQALEVAHEYGHRLPGDIGATNDEVNTATRVE